MQEKDIYLKSRVQTSSSNVHKKIKKESKINFNKYCFFEFILHNLFTFLFKLNQLVYVIETKKSLNNKKFKD